MVQQAHFDQAHYACCPRCGGKEISSMAELGDLISTPSYQFSSDLAEWLAAPQSPDRPTSNRRRVGRRNAIAFSIVWVIVFSVACYALTGALPSLPFGTLVVASACVVGIRTWRNESRLAAEEDHLMLETHIERYRSYLHRRRVWSRLRYCFRCAMVVDPQTLQATSIYDVHELATRRVTGVSLK
jgi:hypothetical protein